MKTQIGDTFADVLKEIKEGEEEGGYDEAYHVSIDNRRSPPDNGILLKIEYNGEINEISQINISDETLNDEPILSMYIISNDKLYIGDTTNWKIVTNGEYILKCNILF